MPSFYRNADACILVYDISNRESFEKVQYWIDEVKSKINSEIVTILVGNKSDLEEFRQVTLNEGLETANINQIMFIEVSAKTSCNIEELFTLITKKLVEKDLVESQDHGLVQLDTSQDTNNSKCMI